MWVNGAELPDVLRSQVLNAYCYRMTHESVQRWPSAARHMRRGGFRLPLISDAEWLSITEFKLTSKGELDQRTRYCHSNRSLSA